MLQITSWCQRRTNRKSCMLGQMRGSSTRYGLYSIPSKRGMKMRRRAVYSPNGELMSFQSPDWKKNSTSSSPIIYHGNGPSLAKLFNRFSHLTWPSYTCSQHFRYSSQSKQNRTLFQCGCSHNNWFAHYTILYSHLDELMILRSDYRLHHAADSQLACDEDEGRHCK